MVDTQIYIYNIYQYILPMVWGILVHEQYLAVIQKMTNLVSNGLGWWPCSQVFRAFEYEKIDACIQLINYTIFIVNIWGCNIYIYWDLTQVHVKMVVNVSGKWHQFQQYHLVKIECSTSMSSYTHQRSQNNASKKNDIHYFHTDSKNNQNSASQMLVHLFLKYDHVAQKNSL